MTIVSRQKCRRCREELCVDLDLASAVIKWLQCVEIWVVVRVYQPYALTHS